MPSMADRPGRSSLGLVAGSLATGVAVALLLVWWVRRERAAHLEEWRARLSATVEDRRAGLDTWIEERIGGALAIAQYPSTLSLLDRRARPSQPFSEEGRGADHVRDVLDRLRSVYHYRAVWIVDASGGIAASSGSLEPDFTCLEIAREVQARREPLVAFHERSDGAVVAGAAAPVLASEGRPLGAVLIEIDPRRNVYLMLTTEPSPTRSGETLLVKKEGADVVFLSPLRHGKGGPLLARRPLASSGLAATAALSGVGTFGEFVDYRGARVLAATGRLRNAPWRIVTKIDADEAFEVYDEQMRQSAAAASGLLLAAAGVAFGLWRQRTASSRLALARSEARFGLLLEHAADAILFVRQDGRIANVNRRAEELYGYRRSELLAMHIHDLCPPPGRADVVGTDVRMRMVAAGHSSGLAFAEDHLTRDGRLVPVEVSGRLVELDGEGLFLAIVRDVRERKAAEKRIALLNRLLRTLSEVNRAMARESDPERLVSEACRILVAHGGFRMAWIGLGDPGTGQVVPVAWSGHDDGYLSEVVVGKDETPFGHGPVSTSLHEGRTVVVSDVETDERLSPMREAARRRGYRSLAAAPVPTGGGTPTVLALYAAEPGFFEAEVVKVVEELAGDVGFALRSIETDRERTQALEDLCSSEAALRESEARFKRLAENAPDVIYRLRLWPSPAVEYVNRAVEVIGHSPDEFLADPGLLGRLIHPDDLHVMEATFRGELSPTQPTRIRWVRDDGSIVWTEIHSVAVRDGDGRVVAVEGISRDVTGRVAAEQALRRLSAAVEQSPVSVLITDARGAIEYTNPAFTRLTGYTLEEVKGRNPRLLQSGHTPVETHADLWRTISSGGEWRGEMSNRRKDGSIYLERASISGIRDADGHLLSYLSVAEDITEFRRAEEVLRETREQLLQAQKLEAVGRLAGGVAHDFNNILGVVLGHAEFVLHELHSGDENRPRLEQIMAAARRAADLTRQLLAFSRRQVLRAQVVNLNAVVLDTREMLQRLIGEDVELRTCLEADLGQVKVDPGQMGQVLVNLALNARDAMPEGGTLAVETANATLDQPLAGEPDTLLAGSYVRLRVCDTGTGIEDVFRRHIFEPFFTTKAQGLGSGLGLSTVYGIVTQSGGTIQVDSSPGRGTAFTIYLPRLEDAAVVVPAVPVEEAPRGGAETILVVEDEGELRSLICEVLGAAGHTVLAAASGPEALARAESHAGSVQLLLTDVVMPGMNGRELAERLTALRPGLRVLFISGYASDVIAKRGVLEERVDLLEKPFSRASLLRRVRRALDGKPFNPAAPPGSWRPAPRA